MAGLALFVHGAFAQSPAAYPQKPIRLVVAVAPGGGTDILARIFANPLSQSLGQPVIVENKPGAYSIIGADFVAKAPPDGYTLLFGGTGPMAANQALNSKLPYNVLRDFTPISIVGIVPVVISVRPTLKARNLSELVQLAKEKPEGLSYSSSSTSFQMAAEDFSRKAGVKLLHVPYRGSGPASLAVATGEVDIGFTDMAGIISLARGDRVRLLAVTAEPRPAGVEKVPLTSEAGMPGYDFSFFHSFAAPAGTPAPIVEKLYEAISKAIAQPTIRARMLDAGVFPTGLTPSQSIERIRRDIQVYTEVGKAANIKVD